MKITLSSTEMLAQWKLCWGFEPLREDCEITRSDGIDLDTLLRLEMRNWYLNLLKTAPIDMLAVKNIANDIAIVVNDDNSGIVQLPETCRRLVEFQLKGWKQPAKIIDDANCRDALLQSNIFSRGGCEQPVVIKRNNRLHIYSLPDDNPSILRAMAVMEPTNGTYEMDESALSTMLNS